MGILYGYTIVMLLFHVGARTDRGTRALFSKSILMHLYTRAVYRRLALYIFMCVCLCVRQ